MTSYILVGGHKHFEGTHNSYYWDQFVSWRRRQYVALKACNYLPDQNTNFHHREKLKYHHHHHHRRQNRTLCEVRSSMSHSMIFLLSDHHSRRVNIFDSAFRNVTSNTDSIPYSFQIISPTLPASLCPLHNVTFPSVSATRAFGCLILEGKV
jgi:hypothetical protein